MKISQIKHLCLAIAIGSLATPAVSAPKAVDLSDVIKNSRLEFIGADKLNTIANGKAGNAAVRLLASCAQSALGCAVVTPPGGGGGSGNAGGGGNGPTGPVVEVPNLSGIVADDGSASDLAAACVQDESFCKDANLKRVANRNSVIDEIFFYTEL